MWFDGSYRVVNERDIIFPGGQVIRPDRVMIQGDHAVVVDYKFGAEEHEEYVGQVKRYREVIETITRLHTKGYIWYVMSGKLIEVG
jgi:ATP-dependent helicase/nuclease subunit A